jgi:hypothetical protein
MQTKFIFIIALLFSVAGFSQQSFYTVTTNDSKLPGKGSILNVSIIPDQESTAFSLFVQNEEGRKIQLQISHQEYGLLVDTVFENTDYKCRYNFEQVEDGRYEVTLINGKQRVTKNIEINTVTRRNLVVR